MTNPDDYARGRTAGLMEAGLTAYGQSCATCAHCWCQASRSAAARVFMLAGLEHNEAWAQAEKLRAPLKETEP